MVAFQVAIWIFLCRPKVDIVLTILRSQYGRECFPFTPENETSSSLVACTSPSSQGLHETAGRSVRAPSCGSTELRGLMIDSDTGGPGLPICLDLCTDNLSFRLAVNPTYIDEFL